MSEQMHLLADKEATGDINNRPSEPSAPKSSSHPSVISWGFSIFGIRGGLPCIKNKLWSLLTNSTNFRGNSN